MIVDAQGRPFSRVEERSDYTQLLTDLALQNAEGDSALPTIRGVAVARSCMALFGRAFMAAAVTPDNARTASLTPEILAHLGRSLCYPGEAVYAIDVRGGRVVLTPCASWDVTGGHDPASWVYTVDLAGPSSSETHKLPADSILHVRAELNGAQPWEGSAGLRGSSLTRILASQLERRLGEEAGAPIAKLIEVAIDGGDDALDNVTAKVRGAKGRAVFVEAARAAADVPSAAPQRGYKPVRVGVDPPEHAVSLRKDVQIAVCAAAGVPPSLVLSSQGSDRRESFRQWIATTVKPLARVVETACSAALETDVKLDFSTLTGAEVAVRSKAIQSLVAAGVPLADAREIVGL